MLIIGIIVGMCTWEVAGEKIKFGYGKLTKGKAWVAEQKAKLNGDKPSE